MFCNLHVHTEYSQLDGLGTAKDYAERAAFLGQKYLASTDHGNIDGLIKFQSACHKAGIKPVLGCEAYLTDDHDSKERRHICLFIKNETGFQNLTKLLTSANLENFYYRPRILHDQLLNNCEGLVVSTACIATFIFGKFGLILLKKLYDRLGPDLYFEIMPHNMPQQLDANAKVIKLAQKYGGKLISTNDCHYIKRGDAKAQEVLLAIQSKAKWKDPKRFRFTFTGLYLRSERDMRRAYRKQGELKPKLVDESLDNTIELAEKCSGFTIKQMPVKLPRVKGRGIHLTAEPAFMINLCHDNFKKIFGKDMNSAPQYISRFKEELNLIIKKKFVRYFLIVWELIAWCKENNILVGPGRGSVGGSLIAYLMGITSVDPIEHGLLFSRFISEDRIDLPDIDIDFEHTKRHLVRQHLEEMYGENNIAGVSSFNRLKGRSVVRDVARVFEVPDGEVDRFAKLIDETDTDDAIQDVIDEYPEGQEFANEYPHVIKYAKRLEGQVRGYSQHAAAIVVSRSPIGQTGRCNLLERDGVTLVNWEKEDTEYVGLLKIDALGLKLLSILSETKKLIKDNYNKDIDLTTIPLDDEKVFKNISDGHTVGLFQMNTWAMTSLLTEMGKLTFSHVTASLALVRPGPSASGMTEEYIKRKNGKEWNRRHEVYEELTKETYGLLVYQEQVMSIISKVAGLPYSTADKIRKIIGKKRDPKEFEQYRKTFIKGCIKEKIFNRTEADEFWEGLQEWARYGFNKSHSVEYAILGYWCGWLKQYYPTEFICASLTHGAQKKKAELVEEAYRLGLVLVLPKVGISDPFVWRARGRQLFVPFIEVKGLGEKKAITAAQSNNKNGITKFFNKKETPTVQQHKGQMGKLLKSIGAYDVTVQQTNISQSVKDLFEFRIVTSAKNAYPQLSKIFGSIRLDRMERIVHGDLAAITKYKPRKRLINNIAFEGHNNLSRCHDCELRDQASAPVHPSPGRINVIITGEAPGPDEDRKGKGFIGRSGNMIWTELKQYKLRRAMFHITNINKCYPSISRKPNSEQIKVCSKFIRREIKEVNPIIILAFGNTSQEFFTGKKSGIVGISGSITWDESHGCWIVWSVHPSFVLHNPDNKHYFTAAIKSFANLYKALK